MDVVCKQKTKAGVLDDVEPSSKDEKKICCAYCLHIVTDPSSQIAVNGSFTHVFANPHGYVYEIGCFGKADGCRPASTSSSEFSWFSGFSWQIGICEQCSSHLGWIFSSDTKVFYGLIIDKLIFP